MSRRLRFFAAILAALSLLASEVAMSSHGCAKSGRMAMPEQVGSSTEWRPAAICLEHCTVGAKAALKQPSAAQLQPALLQWLRMRVGNGRFAVAGVVTRRAPLPPQPPPFIRFAVLRI